MWKLFILSLAYVVRRPATNPDPYQLDKSISNIRGVRCTFYSISNRNFCKQTVLRRLIWVCTVSLCPNNGTLG